MNSDIEWLSVQMGKALKAQTDDISELLKDLAHTDHFSALFSVQSFQWHIQELQEKLLKELENEKIIPCPKDYLQTAPVSLQDSNGCLTVAEPSPHTKKGARPA